MDIAGTPDTILVLGGGTRLPERLLEGGFRVIFAGLPEEFSAAHRSVCTEAWLGADLDESAWLRRAVLLHEEVPFRRAVTVRERFLTLAARINDRLGLGGNPLRTVLALKDKALMRAHLADNTGILPGTVAFRLLNEPTDLTSFVAATGLPIVVKPRDGSGSEGVTIVTDNPGLRSAADRVSTAPGALVAEEFLAGPEFSVETFSENGRHHVIAVTEKFVGAASVEVGHVVPARISEPDRVALSTTTETFLRAMGLQEGPAHTELILTSSGPRVVESHDRTGGDGITDLVRHACGVDQRDLLALHMAGRPTPLLGQTVGAAASWFAVADPGTVTAVHGWEDAASSPGVVAVSPGVRAGDTIRPLDGSDDRCGSVIAVGATPQQALERARSAISRVRIEVGGTDDAPTTATVSITPHRNALTERLMSAMGGATAWPDEPSPERLEVIRQGFGHRLLSRPVLLAADELRSLSDDLNGVIDLLFSLPDRLFGGDTAAFAQAVGLDPVRAGFALHGARAEPARLSRADLYHDGTTFKLLEVNLSSALAGTQIAELNRLYLENPAFDAFASRERLTFPDPVRQLAELIVDTAGTTAPRVAIMDMPDGDPTIEAELRLLAELLSSYGIEAFFGTLAQVSGQGGSVSVAGRPVDLVYRCFTLGELTVDNATISQAKQMLDQLSRGGIPVLSPLSTSLYGNKATLALLWDDRCQITLDQQERALLGRVLPWTQRLRTDSAELMTHCERERKNLIVKPAHGRSGKGTVLGRNLTDAQWAAHLRASDGHVVQEIVTPATEEFADPGTDLPTRWSLNWGVFLIGRGYAGTWIRGLPSDRSDVISYETGAFASCAFNVR